MRRFIVIALVAIACHRSAPTEPSPCRPIMGALADSWVTGRVRDANGEGVAGVRVRLVSTTDSTDAHSAWTTAQGDFYAADIWHGTYTYTVTLPNQQQPVLTDRTTLQCGANTLMIWLR